MSLYLERSKARLKKEVSKEIMSLFEKCLDYVEVTLPDEKIYKVVRGKILRSGNNAIRAVNNTIDENYTISYSPETGVSEDFIRVGKQL